MFVDDPHPEPEALARPDGEPGIVELDHAPRGGQGRRAGRAEPPDVAPAAPVGLPPPAARGGRQGDDQAEGRGGPGRVVNLEAERARIGRGKKLDPCDRFGRGESLRVGVDRKTQDLPVAGAGLKEAVAGEGLDRPAGKEALRAPPQPGPGGFLFGRKSAPGLGRRPPDGPHRELLGGVGGGKIRFGVTVEDPLAAADHGPAPAPGASGMVSGGMKLDLHGADPERKVDGNP